MFKSLPMKSQGPRMRPLEILPALDAP